MANKPPIAFKRFHLVALLLIITRTACLGAQSLELVRMGSWPGYARGTPYDIVLADNKAFIAADQGGLLIFDITNLKAPSYVGSYDTPGYAQGVDVSGQYAYLADGPLGLKILDVANPAAPQLVASKVLGQGVWNVYKSSNYVYAMGGSVWAVDVSDPQNPVVVSTWSINPFEGGAAAVQVESNRLYALSYNTFSETFTFDVFEGELPRLELRLGSFTTNGAASDFQIRGGLAYVATESGLQIYDLRNPESIQMTGRQTNGSPARSVYLEGNYCYLANGLGLQIVNVSDPRSPSTRGSAVTGRTTQRVSKSGGYAFLADAGGLRVVNVIDPTRPIVAGQALTEGYAYEVKVAGGNAFVADLQAGLQVIDVRNDRQFSRIATYDSSGSAYGLDLAGSYAYVADNDGGLKIIDVSDPAALRLATSLSASNAYIQDVTVRGNAAYAMTWYEGVRVFDISVPTNPVYITTVSNVARGNYPMDFFIDGNVGYLADSSLGLRIFDVSNPTNLLPVGSWIGSGNMDALAVSGHYAYLANGEYGIRIIDVGNPTSPNLVGTYTNSHYARDLQLQGDLLYVASSVDGLKVLDISMPANPVLVATAPSSSGALGLALSGNRIYVAQANYGLTLYAQIFPITMQIARETADGAGIQINGTQGFPVVIESASDPTNPENWNVLLQTNPPAFPFILHEPSLHSGSKFYRARQP